MGSKQPSPRVQAHDLLLEIRTEEMPASYLAYADDAQNDLFRKAFGEVFSELTRDFAGRWRRLDVFLTPRRVVLHCQGLSLSGAAIREPVYGPSLSAAYTQDGKPTAAFRGFVKSKGIKPQDVVELEHRGKRCVAYWKVQKPPSLKDLLAACLPAFLNKLSFPKTMQWDNSGLSFPRPIRSILCLLDNKPVSLRLGNLVSGNKTYDFQRGIRRSIRVKGISHYFQVLRQWTVTLDAAKRKGEIEKQVKQLTKKRGGTYVRNAALLDEVAFLAERPVAVLGSFDRSFSELPREVLRASLAAKQRLFSIVNASGNHLPYFIGILDHDSPKAFFR